MILVLGDVVGRRRWVQRELGAFAKPPSFVRRISLQVSFEVERIVTVEIRLFLFLFYPRFFSFLFLLVSEVFCRKYIVPPTRIYHRSMWALIGICTMSGTSTGKCAART